MIRTSWLIAIALGAFGVALVRADDTYTIKIKPTGKGDVGQITKEESEDGTVTFTNKDGQSKQQKNARKETDKFKEEILEKEKGKRATSLKRVYDKAVETKDGKESELPYNGKTVLIKKDGGKFIFKLDGGKELDPESVPSLVKEFKRDDDEEKIQELFLPKKAVAVNDTWNIDKDALKQMFKDDEDVKIDPDNATATGKLLKAYKKGDKQYGVIQYDIMLPLASYGKDAFEKGSKMTLKLTLDVCIDGSEDVGTVKAEIATNGKFTIAAQGVTVQIDSKSSSTESREEAKK